MAQEVAMVVALISLVFDSVVRVMFPFSLFSFQDMVGSHHWNQGIPRMIRSFPKFVTKKGRFVRLLL